jgi:hypothetical protein
MPQTVLGLDIGQSTIKAVVFTKKAQPATVFLPLRLWILTPAAELNRR